MGAVLDGLDGFDARRGAGGRASRFATAVVFARLLLDDDDNDDDDDDDASLSLMRSRHHSMISSHNTSHPGFSWHKS